LLRNIQIIFAVPFVWKKKLSTCFLLLLHVWSYCSYVYSHVSHDILPSAATETFLPSLLRHIFAKFIFTFKDVYYTCFISFSKLMVMVGASGIIIIIIIIIIFNSIHVYQRAESTTMCPIIETEHLTSINNGQ
jgi:hypothetical protein